MTGDRPITWGLPIAGNPTIGVNALAHGVPR